MNVSQSMAAMRKTRSYIAVGLSTALLILLPPAGGLGLGFAAFRSATPEGVVCGLFVYPLMLVTIVGALLGLAAGVGAGWLATLGFFRWANGSGLEDIRDYKESTPSRP
jgi:hypothetical protein